MKPTQNHNLRFSALTMLAGLAAAVGLDFHSNRDLTRWADENHPTKSRGKWRRRGTPGAFGCSSLNRQIKLSGIRPAARTADPVH